MNKYLSKYASADDIQQQRRPPPATVPREKRPKTERGEDGPVIVSITHDDPPPTSLAPPPIKAVKAETVDASPPPPAETTFRVGWNIVSKEEFLQNRITNDPKIKRQAKREADKLFDKEFGESEWVGGLAQKALLEKNAEIQSRIAQQPLQQFTLDKDVDRDLQARPRWEDPLARAAPAPSKFAAPPNRFDISAGHRWDGVVRGTGYESRWMEQKNYSTAIKRDRVAALQEIDDYL